MTHPYSLLPPFRGVLTSGLLFLTILVVAAVTPRTVAAAGEAKNTPVSDGGMLSLDYSPDGKMVAGGGGDKAVRLWDAPSERLRYTLVGHTTGVYGVHFSPNGETLISQSLKEVKLWNCGNGKLIATLAPTLSPGGESHEVWTANYSPDGGTVAVGGFELWQGKRSGEVLLWDAHTGVFKTSLNVGEGEEVGSISFSPDGKWMAVGAQTKAQLWKMPAGEFIRDLTTGGAGYSAVFSPDGKRVAFGNIAEKAIEIQDVVTGFSVLLRNLAHPVQSLEYLAFSPDGRMLVSRGGEWMRRPEWVGKEGNQGFELKAVVTLWDVRTGAVRWRLQQDTNFWVTFSPDSRLLASGGEGAVKLWDVETGKLKSTLPPYEGARTPVAFSPDGKTLAGGGKGLDVVFRKVME